MGPTERAIDERGILAAPVAVLMSTRVVQMLRDIPLREAQKVANRDDFNCFPVVVPGPTWEELETRARTNARKRLAELSAAGARSGVRVRAHLADGTPEEQVARLARRRHAALVVIGTHARTGLSRAFMGSVAERIVRSTACPVLTVRSPG